MVDSPGVGSSAAGATPQRGSPARAARGRGPRSFPSAGASATGQGPAIPSSAGQVGVGVEAIRPAPPESGPAGAVEASRTRRTGATRPKTGGSTVCGGIPRRKGLEGPLWASHGGAPSQRRGP